MINLFLFIFGTIGITHIIVDSDMPIILWFKKLVSKSSFLTKLLGCYQCTGTWVGFFSSYMLFPDIDLWQIFIAGCAGSFLANTAAIFLNYVEARTIISLSDEEK